MISVLLQRINHQKQRLALLWLLLRKGRISLRKIGNALVNTVAFWRKSEVAGRAPTLALLDISSHCNMYCVTCRRSCGDLIDISGQSEIKTALGSMAMDRFSRIIDDLHLDTLMVSLYATGEPLLNVRVADMVTYASARGLATMLSTNGMLLDEEMSEKILMADVDYCKVAVSGFTQDVYGIYHRGGDISRVLGNIACFEAVRRRLGRQCMVVVDYVLFEHNRNEEDAVRCFCSEHGINFSLRYGRVFENSGVSSPDESRKHYVTRTSSCDWVWNIMTVCFDGRVVPCCQFATCANPPYVMGDNADEDVISIWNGQSYREFRRIQAAHGRGSLSMCKHCFYSGIDFQS